MATDFSGVYSDGRGTDTLPRDGDREVQKRLDRPSNSQPASFSMSYTNPADTYRGTGCRDAAR